MSVSTVPANSTSPPPPKSTSSRERRPASPWFIVNDPTDGDRFRTARHQRLPLGTVRIAAAILADAYHSLERQRSRKVIDEVLDWMGIEESDPEATHVFSFLRCCEYLGLEPAAVRVALARQYPVVRAAFQVRRVA